MRLFIVEDGKWNEVTELLEDAVVCQRCLSTDYDFDRFDCISYDSALNEMESAPAGSVCWLCNEEDPA